MVTNPITNAPINSGINWACNFCCHLTDVLTALLAGSFGYIVVEILQQKLHAQFIPEFMG
jgi:uncharacterized membrane protein YjjP (DUF1212 family)